MTRRFLYAKIHRATVTECALNYEGSISIDPDLLEQVGMNSYEQCSIVDITNGERMETYIIEGKRGSREFCMNGAAARKAQVGDKIIVMTYCDITAEEMQNHKPNVMLVNDKNEPTKIYHDIISGTQM